MLKNCISICYNFFPPHIGSLYHQTKFLVGPKLLLINLQVITNDTPILIHLKLVPMG